MGRDRGDNINAANPAMVLLIVEIFNPSDGLRIADLSKVALTH
jgi:hypothetical protein